MSFKFQYFDRTQIASSLWVMMRIFNHICIAFILLLALQSETKAQGFDSTQIGKEYPYALPILGEKAYTKGYKLPLPHGIMINSIWNKQNIVIENIELAFLPDGVPLQEDDYYDFSEIITFGPSTGRINTLSFRASTWVLPFLAVSVNYGEVWGEQVIRLTKPIEIQSVTDIVGRYYGFDLLTVVPVGPLNVALNWAPSWTTNVRLNKPVRVDVISGRIIKNFPVGKKPDRFLGVWVGVQFQKLASTTEGSIPLQEALDPTGENQEKLDNWYNGLTPLQKELYGDRVYEAFNNFFDTRVHYRFDKRLEENYNMLIGGQYQFNRKWQLRAEYGTLATKQQLMLSLNYAFGL